VPGVAALVAADVLEIPLMLFSHQVEGCDATISLFIGIPKRDLKGSGGL
jgi:hypothetical protein